MKNLTGLYWENQQFPSNMYDNITYTFNIGTVTAYYDDNSSSVITEGFTFESDKGSIGNYSSITNSLEFTSPEKVYKEEQVNITLSYTENGITQTATVNYTIQPNPMHKSDCIFDTIQKNIHRRWDRFVRTLLPETRLISKLNVENIEDPVSLGDISKYSEIEVDGKKIVPETNNYTFNSTGTHTIKYVLKEPATLTTQILNDSAIEEVTIPKSINSISSNAIPNSTKRITVSSDNSTYYSEDNAVVETSTHKLIFGVDTVPSGVVTIGEETFKEKDITYIVIPSSVTTIEDSAFDSCENLLNITFGSNVSSIGDDVLDGCSNIATITFEGAVPPTLSSNFGIINDDFIIYVPTASESTYKQEWSTYEDKIYTPNCIIYKASEKLAETTSQKSGGLHTNAFNTTITSHTFDNGIGVIKFDSDVTSVGNYAFYNCTNITKIIFPNTIVGSIGSSAFYGCSGLTSVEIPSRVTSIGSSAFYGCSGLTSVVIPSSVTSIEYLAFMGCTSLTSIDIPSSVTSINSSVFSKCSGLTSVTIPNSVTSIGQSAFYGCSGLTSITIPSSVNSIGYGAFGGCSVLTSIVVESDNSVYDSRNNCNAIIKTSSNTLIAGCKNSMIPSSVTSIGEGAFVGCSGLTSITIPSSVTKIGNGAFSYCSGLTSVVIPNSVTYIGTEAFRDCYSLISVEIPSSVTGIGNSTFYDCSGLTFIEIPDSVTYIGTYVFSGCSGLTSVVIPSSVTSIGNHIFDNCSSLTSIVVESDNSVYDSRNNCNAIIETASNTLITGCKNTMIPSSVTNIGESAFYKCSALTSINIPNGVKSIGDNAFYGCSGLTSIEIPSSVTSIGGCAFQDCSNIVNITSLAITEPSIYTNTFRNVKTNGTLYVPIGSSNYYTWMSNSDYYLGSYGWTKVEQ